MSLYDRDYMRNRGGYARSDAGGVFSQLRVLGAVKVLILINAICFALEIVFDSVFGYGAFFGMFELSVPALLSGKVWTLLTYSFLHADFFHIFANMLGLFFIGTPLEKMIGTRRFCAVYFLGALLGGLLWLALSWNDREGLVGASAAVMSVFACFCAVCPPYPITFLLFFVLPVSMMPMTMLKIAALIEVLGLVSSFGGAGSVVAYSAHLGGMGAGLLAARAFSGRIKLVGIFADKMRKFFKVAHTADLENGQKRAADYKFSVDIRGDGRGVSGGKEEGPSMSRRVDEILDKINERGFSSLTEEERDFLRRARDASK